MATREEITGDDDKWGMMINIAKNPYKCPKCGSSLIKKTGIYGKFMACPDYPHCQYTKPMWSFEKPYCEKCGGKGLIPFVKNGAVIPHAFEDCDCAETQPGGQQPLSPEDIDYPISYSYYRSLCQNHGWADPGPDTLPEQPRELDTPRSIYELDMKSKEIIQQLKAQILYFDKRLKEQLTQQSNVAKRKKYTIK